MLRTYNNKWFQTLGGATLGALLAFMLAVAPPCSAEVTEDFHKTVPITANGRVSLENINGNVTITGWDRNEVQIDAVKSARDQQRLDEARIEVDEANDAVRIRTRYPEHNTNNNPASVRYELHVPRAARLDKIDLVNGSLDVQQISGEVNASLVNGSLHARDLAGRSELSTVNGALQADFNSLNNVRDISLKSVNGSIALALPPSPNADIEANTVSGSIRTDFPLEVRGHFVGKSVNGKLGSGGTRIEMSNVNGSIRIGPGQGSL
jgi:DUF4097 and DUF4098 domain-containing protein YvlB